MSRTIGNVLWIVTLTASAAFAQAQATQPAAEYHPGGYPETYNGTFYPGTELRALPGARAQAVAARAEFRRAQQDLDNAIADIQRRFIRSPDYIAAQAEQRAAYDDLLAIRASALRDLKDDSDYQAAVALRARLADQIETLRQDGQASVHQLLAMATVKLSYSTIATAMESAAMAADPRIASARQRVMEAGNRLAVLYQQFDEAVRTNPVVLAERKHVQDARIAAAASDALYVEAANVANVAMDYAYHMYDRPYPYAINGSYYGSTYGTYSAGYPIGYPSVWWWHNRRN